MNEAFGQGRGLVRPAIALLGLLLMYPAAAAAEPAPGEDRLETAKRLYVEGDEAFAERDYAAALEKFELAYTRYAEEMHAFAFNIGMAAYELGDCVKAREYFRRFVNLVPDHPAHDQALLKLGEIEASGCADVSPPPPDPGGGGVPTGGGGPAVDPDPPKLIKRRPGDGSIVDPSPTPPPKPQRPLLIAGAVLTGLGGAALIGGGVSAGIANRRANELADLASPGRTGFPDGDYSDDQTYDLDRNALPANNRATIALFVSGGLLATTGVTLLVVHAVRKRRAGERPGDANAHRPRPRVIAAGATPIAGGGAASATLRF